MTKQTFAMRYKAIIADACDTSELWTGTIISDIIEVQKEQLIVGVENGDAEEVTDELFPRLRETIESAQKQYEYQ